MGLTENWEVHTDGTKGTIWWRARCINSLGERCAFEYIVLKLGEAPNKDSCGCDNIHGALLEFIEVMK